MKKIILLITGLLFTSLLVTLEATNIYYYSTVGFVETPLSPFQGSIPLAKEEALTRNHYQFTYNDKNQLIRIAFFNGQTPKQPNHTANLFTLAHRMEFAYKDMEERISFFGIDGQQISVLGDCYQFIYTLNELGNRKALHFENEQQQRIENSWNIFEYEWTYQADGTVIEDRFDSKGKGVSIRPGFEFYRLKLFFNANGQITLMQNIDGTGNMVENASGAAQDKISMNKSGHFLQWQVLNKLGELEKGNGPDVAIGIQTFNEYGYETGLEHRDEANQLMYNAYGICKSKTTFDQWGNISERQFYDQNSAPALHEKAVYHMLKMLWDETGNHRTQLSYYNLEGQPTLHKQRGYHSVYYEYDQQNRLQKISYRDTNEHLVNRLDNGIAYIIYEFDEDKGTQSKKAYNREGTLIQ